MPPTDTPRRRLLWTALLLALCSVALTGCFRVELAIKVNEDGSGVFGAVLAFDESFLRLLGEAPEAGDLFDLDALPPGAVVVDYREEEYVGHRVTVELAHMEQLPQVLGALDEASEAVDDLDPVGNLELERDGDGWRFSMAVPPLGAQVAEAGDGSSLEDLSELLETMSYTIRLALPGEITEHNADHVEEDELVWELDMTSTEARTLSARSQPVGGLGNWAILAIGIGGGAALLAAVVLLARRSHRPA